MPITWKQGRTIARNMPYQAAEYTNRFVSEVLPDGCWAGRPCFIVGGGPSLVNFDWTRLKGVRTIGINRAFERFDPTVMFSMDLRFLGWLERAEYGKEVTAKFNACPSYKVFMVTYCASLRHDLFIVPVKGNYMQGMHEFTSTLREGIGHGNNSGYAALNLACCWQANPIYLLGFDMKHEGARTHWHNGHIITQLQSSLDSYVNHFNRAARCIRRTGAKVVNLNPDSALRCFEFGSIDEVLN